MGYDDSFRSIKELIECIYQSGKWSYYQRNDLKTKFPEILELFYGYKSIDFIDQYLQAGGKSESLTLKKYYMEILKEDRAKHTLSIFFIGILLYENYKNLKVMIDNHISFIENNSEQCNPFCYYWFLICFYHDVGYNYEEDNHELLNRTKDSKLKRKKVFRKWSLTFLDELRLEIPKMPVKLFTEDKLRTIYEETWKNYFYYRLSKGKIDHGIFGGLLFYTDRKKKYKELREEKQQASFSHGGVWWSKKLIDGAHSYVAWVIIAHNIWFLNSDADNYEKTKVIYAYFGLDKLINPDVKISLNNSPFLFLLSIVDTIDPVKYFCRNKFGSATVTEVFENVKISCNNNSFSIICKLSKYKDYFRKYEELEKWLDVTCSTKEDTITLNFNFNMEN